VEWNQPTQKRDLWRWYWWTSASINFLGLLNKSLICKKDSVLCSNIRIVICGCPMLMEISEGKVARWLICRNFDLLKYNQNLGTADGGTVVKVLCYKSEGRWFDSRWWHWNFDRSMALGSTHPLTEMSTRSISWGKGGRCVRLTTLPPSCGVVM
jgi:hypothetical protein